MFFDNFLLKKANVAESNADKQPKRRERRRQSDNLCKMLAERYPDEFASWALGRAVQRVKILKTELAIEPVRADSLILLDSEDEIIHIEFQTLPDSEPPLPLRQLDYFVRLYRKYRRPVRQLVLFLKQVTVDIANEFAVGETRHRYTVVKMWEQNPREFLRYEGLLPLTVLCKAKSPEQLLGRVAEEIERIEPLEKRRAVSSWTQILAGLRFSEELIDTFFQEGKDMMQESSVYQAIIRKGEQKGELKGELKGKREMLLKHLARRFGKIGVRIQSKVETLSIEQIEALDDALFDFQDKKEVSDWLRSQTTNH